MVKYGEYEIVAGIFNKAEYANGTDAFKYNIGIIVKGPDDKSYMLDMCCTEHICKKLNNSHMSAGSFIRSLCTDGRLKMVEVTKPDFVSDDDIDDLAKEFKCTKALKRMDGLKEIDTWD